MSSICNVSYDKNHNAEIVNPGDRQRRCFCEWRWKLIHHIAERGGRALVKEKAACTKILSLHMFEDLKGCPGWSIMGNENNHTR